MGGEKFCCIFWGARDQGSPPHGRGKVKGRHGSSPPAGITPAWAGKSAPQAAQNFSQGDHPRMGGEKGAELLAGFCR